MNQHDHQHDLSCIDESPSGDVICKITGEKIVVDPPSTTGKHSQASPASLEADLARDRTTGRQWLEFGIGRIPQEIASKLSQLGWRWSRYRNAWHNPSKFAKVPPEIDARDIGLVDYSTERAERLSSRAEKHETKAQQHYGRFEQITSGIPMGQPILVGHHSEKHHRRDVARMESALRKSHEHRTEAQRLETAARSSGQHQARSQSAPVIKRRLDRLEADLRSMKKTIERIGPGDKAEYQRKIDIVERDIAEQRANLASVGGVQEFKIAPGDLVRAGRNIYRVVSAGPKNFIGEVTQGGAAGMRLKVGREDLQEIVERSASPTASPSKTATIKSGNKERDQLIRFIYSRKPADYRGRTQDGKRSVMTYTPQGTSLVTLEDASDQMLQKLAKDAGWTGAPPSKIVNTPEARLEALRDLKKRGYHASRTIEGVKINGISAKIALDVLEQLSEENRKRLLASTMPHIIAASLKLAGVS